ncbi:MAG TPA: ABC transporter permease [Ktedonobacterales bacterium]|nr:ABC transporter permease [Ktedonobacterales bacterium]
MSDLAQQSFNHRPSPLASAAMRGVRWPQPGVATLGLLAALALGYLALPLVNLLWVEPWADVPAALSDPLAIGAFETSLAGATVSTALIAVGAIPLAYALARWRFPLRSVVTLLVYTPLVFPAVVSGIVQLLVYGPYGVIGGFFAAHGYELDTTFAGVVLAQTFVAAPFAIVAARAAFEAVPTATEDVAATLGASGWRIFWTVSLPQASGGVVAGLILTWLRALGEFGATAVLAYHPYTLPVYIYVQLTGLGTPAALPLALLALGASVVAISLAQLVTARSRIPGAGGAGRLGGRLSRTPA